MSPRGGGGAHAARPPRALLVRPATLDLAGRRRVHELEAELDRLEMTLTVRLAEEARVAGSSRPPVQVLAPDDAGYLYRIAHHGPLLVCATERVYVRRDPSRTPNGPAHLRDLAEFVAHKACHVLVGDRPAIAGLGESFRTWREANGCDGGGDPRALPLHMFRAGRGWPELAEPDGRTAFARAFGSAGDRTDQDGRRWTKAADQHGRQAVHVAGTTLPIGMHWDVGFRQAGRLLGAAEVWSVPRHSYVNVYPDGGVRGGSSDVPPAKVLWPRAAGTQKRPIKR